MSDFATIEQAIDDIRHGKMIVVIDDEDRENEGDLIISAQTVTPADINFMATHAKGLICTPIDGKRLDKLEIWQMVANNTDNHETAFTVSIDAYDTDTGISAFERCHTIKMLLDKNSKPSSFRKPGHVFPLRSVEGGVLRRAGHTETTTDLAKLAGFYPEFINYIGNCKYLDCSHIKEGKDCAIIKKVEDGTISKDRYLRYVDLYEKLKKNWDEKYD